MRSVGVIPVSRNFGHQAALTAGLDAAGADAVIMLDADLQKPPEMIPSFLAARDSRADAEDDERQRRIEMVTLPLVGGCQCGALRYEITQPPLMIYNCHCTNCQTVGGGAFSTPAAILESSISFTKGQPRSFEWTSEAGNRRFGWFCGECGSRIANGQVPAAGIISLRSGTLDDTSWVEPVGDIWTRSAQSWALPTSDRLRTEQQPTDYGPFIERFRAQGRFGG